MKPKLYFGHPMNTYGTANESALLAIISEAFPKYEIENPGNETHKVACLRYRATGRNPMEYFFL
ncbi:MAG: hypothetical protein KKB31_06865 [Nanoarchaeota archaeon]|nr:hypothetical protein [Nanoarchaeota archaeon]